MWRTFLGVGFEEGGIGVGEGAISKILWRRSPKVFLWGRKDFVVVIVGGWGVSSGRGGGDEGEGSLKGSLSSSSSGVEWERAREEKLEIWKSFWSSLREEVLKGRRGCSGFIFGRRS